MKEELENKLYEKFPTIFAEKDLPPSQTCMTRGLECGDGWYAIVNCVCIKIQHMVNMKKAPQVVFIQVKEKNGYLAIHYRGGNDKVRVLIEFADLLSQSTCEICGATKNVLIRDCGCLQSRCEDCHKKLEHSKLMP